VSEVRDRPFIRLAHDELLQYTQNLLAENELLRANLENAAEQNARYAEQYHQIETHSSNMANLYVASYQLHSNVDRDGVLQAIQEIVINLVGSEEVAIFETDPAGDFVLTASFGVDGHRLHRFKAGDGPMGQRLVQGEIFINPAAAGGSDQLTACIPLKVGESLIGAILVFRLLEHKPALQAIDAELFELLGLHASTALYCATLHERVAGGCA